MEIGWMESSGTLLNISETNKIILQNNELSKENLINSLAS